MLTYPQAMQIVQQSIEMVSRVSPYMVTPEMSLGSLGILSPDALNDLSSRIANGSSGVRRFGYQINKNDIQIFPSTTVAALIEMIREATRPSGFDLPQPSIAPGSSGRIVPTVPPPPQRIVVPKGIANVNEEDWPRLVSLWYGTNRKPVDSLYISKGYSAERDNQLHLGQCEVLVPKGHKIGSIGSPWWKRLLTGRDDRLKLESIRSYFPENYWNRLNDFFRGLSAEDRRALVYIHGFNVSFEEAALRAGQIGFDLAIDGAMAFYSWPSKGNLQSYAADGATIESSEDYIEEFLTKFATQSGAEKVHIIAHSMGNRGLLRAMQRIVGSAELSGKVKFGQIFLAAPDVDTDVFLKLARLYPSLSERTTLYVSGKDKALKSSGLVYDAPRAGFTPPVTLVPGIDTVEVSNIDLTLLGHGFFATARDVLNDIYQQIVHNAGPTQRLGLERVFLDDTQSYWRIRA